MVYHIKINDILKFIILFFNFIDSTNFLSIIKVKWHLARIINRYDHISLTRLCDQLTINKTYIQFFTNHSRHRKKPSENKIHITNYIFSFQLYFSLIIIIMSFYPTSIIYIFSYENVEKHVNNLAAMTKKLFCGFQSLSRFVIRR